MQEAGTMKKARRSWRRWGEIVGMWMEAGSGGRSVEGVVVREQRALPDRIYIYIFPWVVLGF